MRTINEIYQSIIDEKMNMPTLKNKLLNEDGTSTLSNEQDLLTSLTSDSKVAIWKLWAYITAVVIWIHESLWYQFKADVNEVISTQFVGTAKWLIEQAKLFQYGDDVIVETPYYHPEYAVVDTSKQIIANANVNEAGGQVYLKVRRKDTDILSSDEFTSFNGYLNKIKVAGQRINILNFDGDELQLYYTIYYNPIYILNNIKNNVIDTISTYIENVEFDANINITDLTDLIQKVEGVKGVQFDNASALPFASTIWTPFTNYYESLAGWNKISTSYPLDSTLTFIQKQ